MQLHPGYEPIIQAFSGMFSVNGTAEGLGARVGMQVLDLGTGVWAALGCLAGLYQRHTTGRGCVVDASLLETALGWLQVILAGFNATGEQPERHRSGNPRVVVFQAFDTLDGEVLIAAANDRLFAKLVRQLGHPEWATDERFASNELRVRHKELLLPEMQTVLMQQPTEHWVTRLEAVGVPCAPIHDLQQMVDQPQTQALKILQEVPGEDLRIVGLPLSFNGERPPVRYRAPGIGEHTADLRAPKKQPGNASD